MLKGLVEVPLAPGKREDAGSWKAELVLENSIGRKKTRWNVSDKRVGVSKMEETGFGNGGGRRENKPRRQTFAVQFL